MDAVRGHGCNVGLLNPPYSQGDEDLHELVFVKHMLDLLQRGGTGVAIVPISCAISPHPLKEEILKHHTLEAVMSMPEELFYPVGVITCSMVFTAHEAHATSDRKTWFGYWRDDGFVKTKHRGRIDLYERWPAIRDRWVKQFRNRDEHAGECVKRTVQADDEWCAEAYMETDYSRLARAEFAEQVRQYVVFSVLSRDAPEDDDIISGDGRDWSYFDVGDLFEIKKGKRLTRADMTPGKTPFIGAIDHSNGLTTKISLPPIHPGNTITVNYNGNGVAEAFYQPRPFWCSDDVNVLYPKFAMIATRALFICTVIKREKYRFSYGRKWHLDRMRASKIRLPARPDGTADWDWIDRFMLRFPLSAALAQELPVPPPEGAGKPATSGVTDYADE